MQLDKKWTLKPASDHEVVSRLSIELGIDPVLAELLAQRGIQTFEQARAFFRPDLNNLHDPFLMKDMDKAVERLTRAVSSGEKILVYGDYDVDGTTAVALVYSFLRKYTKNIAYYIPDRYNEGYGVSYTGLNWAAENGFKLIITLDCGIKAIEKVEHARSKGIDMIICDHHLPEDGLPKAVAVLDPKREDDTYPFDDLSGCGVGFKLVQAYAKTHGIAFEEVASLLDLLAVSIAADLVSVTGENRILAYYGLKQLNSTPNRGLASMIKLAGLDENHITFDDIVFKIGPRLNAAGRMESGRISVELLTAPDDKSAYKVAGEINRHNNDRKDIDRKITEEALGMIPSGTSLCYDNVTIVYKEDWHKGVVGIVASRLVEAYFKPAIVLTKSNGFITGSARSVGGFDLYAAIESCADLLENFGGHLYAAGLTLKEENLEAFVQRLNQAAQGKIQPEMVTPVVNIDAALNFSQITPKFTRILKQFQPFGPGNNLPVFLTENVYQYDKFNMRKVGNNGGHLKMDLIQDSQPFYALSAIAFGKGEYYDYIYAGNPIDVCYSIVENYFRGKENVQLRIKDIRIREEII